MSWNKNTVLDGTIERTIRVLVQAGIVYKLEVRGEVLDMGLGSTDEKVKLRTLIWTNNSGTKYYLVEKMVRHPDCDIDDVVETMEFKDELPDGVPLEITLEEDDDISEGRAEYTKDVATREIEFDS